MRAVSGAFFPEPPTDRMVIRRRNRRTSCLRNNNSLLKLKLWRNKSRTLRRQSAPYKEILKKRRWVKNYEIRRNEVSHSTRKRVLWHFWAQKLDQIAQNLLLIVTVSIKSWLRLSFIAPKNVPVLEMGNSVTFHELATQCTGAGTHQCRVAITNLLKGLINMMVTFWPFGRPENAQKPHSKSFLKTQESN